MKKTIALILTFFYMTVSNCYAFSALYYLKGVKTSDMEPVVENAYASQYFSLAKKNPYYGVSKKGDESVVIILNQSGDNMFYYYQSPEENLKVNKSVIKEIKKQGIVCEQSFNSSLIEIYDNLAKEVSSNTVTLKTYNFEEPRQNAFEPPVQNEVQTKQSTPATYKGYVAQLSPGTKIEAYLQNSINTATANKGDEITAVLTNPLKFNGMEVAPQGSVVYGSLSKARHATYGSRNGRVVINFNRLVTPENKVYDISTEEIDFTVSNEGKVGNAFKSAAAAAVAGALVGLLVGALSGGDHIGRSVAIGAGVGAGSSVIYTTAEAGVDAEIPSFTEIEITLTQPLNVTVGY